MDDRPHLKDIERIEPPDLWTEIQVRHPGSHGLRTPSRARSVVAGGVAILVTVIGVLVPLRLLGSQRGAPVVGVPPGHHTFTITEPSESMEPTIYVGQAVVVDTDAYSSSSPVRGDVIVFDLPGQGMSFIKRVIGLPGDSVEQREGGDVYVNGVKLVEPYVGAVDPKPLGPWSVEPGHVFVMGDNRANSNDSRYAMGQIPLAGVVGRVVLEEVPTAAPSPPPPAAAVSGPDPCPTLPCLLYDTYKVTYRLSDGTLTGMVSYKLDPSDPSAGPNPGEGEAVLDISDDLALVAELAKDIDAYQVNLETGKIERKPGYSPVPTGPSP
jgi:signal peptidase I